MTYGYMYVGDSLCLYYSLLRAFSNPLMQGPFFIPSPCRADAKRKSTRRRRCFTYMCVEPMNQLRPSRRARCASNPIMTLPVTCRGLFLAVKVETLAAYSWITHHHQLASKDNKKKKQRMQQLSTNSFYCRLTNSPPSTSS